MLANAQEIKIKIQEMISRMTGLEKEEITLEANFYRDLGIDSIKAIELTVALQELFGIEIDDDTIPGITSLDKVVKEVYRLLQEKNAK